MAGALNIEHIGPLVTSLMAAMFERAPGLFAYAAAKDRMHAFGASLFMTGYDIGCLKENAPDAGIGEGQRIRQCRA
jgi:hypothetical protein